LKMHTQMWRPQIHLWYKYVILWFFRTPFQQNLSPLSRHRGKPALVMHSAMATPSNCVTPAGINRAEPCPYLHGGETGFSPVSACSPVSRMDFGRQETDISEPRWSCLCRPSQNAPIIYAASIPIGQSTSESRSLVRVRCHSGLGSDSRVLASTITQDSACAWFGMCWISRRCGIG
jgi:hypothetical protein